MRSNGILCAISSLPSKYGVGDLGYPSYQFAKELKEAGIKYRQILPLNPTDVVNSPYASECDLGIDYVYVSLELLKEEGYLQIKPYLAVYYYSLNNTNDILKDVEWNTIFFFIGLFIIIGGLEASGGIKLMAQWILDVTKGSQTATSMIILWASGIISGVIDNIPYTATMAPMLVEIEKTMGEAYTFPLWWALSLGACLGGNMTIIGAAANVIVSENAYKEGHPISFMRFLKYGVIVVAISLIVSTVYIYLRYLK